MDTVEFFEIVSSMPPSRSKPRPPWRPSQPDDETFITLPVYIAFCSIAAAARQWNRKNAKFKVILCLSDEGSLPVYTAAARVFLHRIADYEAHTRPFVSDWGGRYSHRDQLEVLGVDRAIFLKEPSKVLDDEARLFADVVVDVPMRSRGHVEAALRRFGMPIVEKDVELLLSEPWSRLDKAFQGGRSPVLSLQRLRQFPSTSMRTTEPVPAGAWPTLADMAGYGPLVEWGYDLARDLAEYKAGRIRWEDVDDGVLVSGPTGTGKTTFVRALANTCLVSVIAGSFSIWQSAGSLSDFLKAMRDAFEEARSKAPSILFIDEVDSFGTRNGHDHNNAYMTSAISGFLELLDGFHQREGVVVVAACNHPQNLDPAIRRAGRLDRHFTVGLPDAQSRLAILGFHSGLELNESHAERFMKASEGYSGAAIEQLVRDARRKARRSLEALSAKHIVDQLRPLEELTEEYLRVLAVHEAGHALVAIEIGHGQVREVKISGYRIEGQPSELGYVEYGQAEGKPKTRSDYLNAIAVCVGGIAAELERFGTFAEGASGFETADLNLATELATALEGGRGMGHTLIVEDLQSERLRAMRVHNSEFRRQVHDILDGELGRARAIINARRAALDEIVRRLMETKFMTGDEVVEIVKRHRRPTVSLAKLPRSAMGA